MATIHVFLADDHAVVRRGLEALIETEGDMEVVGTAADGVEAVERAVGLRPDVILLDMKMPHMGGVEAIRAIKGQMPEARVLVLTSFNDDETVFGAIQAGALGFLLKDSGPAELIQAIRNTYEGKPTLHPEISLRVIRELEEPTGSGRPLTAEPLTARELEVLQWVARGLTNQEIADRLVMSERTVRTHITHILRKLHLANRTQATLYALREGLAGLEE
jgi:NarL family two-component system response regulator LiaR